MTYMLPARSSTSTEPSRPGSFVSGEHVLTRVRCAVAPKGNTHNNRTHFCELVVVESDVAPFPFSVSISVEKV